MGAAFHLAREHMQQEYQHMLKLRDHFLQALSEIKNMRLNTNLTHCVPHILNLRFEGMLADAILAKLPFIAASTASACQGKGTEGSYVLRAMGYTDEQIKSSVRFSFGRFTTLQDINEAARLIKQIF